MYVEKLEEIEKVYRISLDKLVDFSNHPFQVRNDEEMQDLIEKINEKGVNTPLIVRPKKDRYEIISGHRRKYASQMAHYRDVPCIIREMSDDEAIIMMVDSNHQREKILPSEKAFAYKMRLEAEKRQGKRNDLTSSQPATKLNEKGIAQKVGKEFGDSRDTVYRYIRLTELLPEILQKVDEEKIGLTPAVEISYLSKEEQTLLLDAMKRYDATPTYSQTLYMKELSKQSKLTADKIYDIMEQEKPNQVEKFKINYERVEKLFPSHLKSNKQKEDFIIQCIEEHNKRERNKSKVR